jgi:UDP-N-acetyl-D-glucosamine dehydrogenase
MSYKSGVGDVRESPAITIAEHLLELRADLSYHDPYVPHVPELGLSSVDLGSAAEEAELVVILTAHPDIDHLAVAEAAPLVLDFRGALRKAAAASGVRR